MLYRTLMLLWQLRVQFLSWCTWVFFLCLFFFFFFSSRRRHTRCREVSWARRCVQETVSTQSTWESTKAAERTYTPFRRNATSTLKSEALRLSTQQGSMIRISALVSPRNVKSTTARKINYATCDSPASRAQQREEFTRKLREEIQERNMKLLKSQQINEEPVRTCKIKPSNEIGSSRHNLDSHTVASHPHPIQSFQHKKLQNNFVNNSTPRKPIFPNSAKFATSKKITFDRVTPTIEKYAADSIQPTDSFKMKPRGMFAQELDELKEKIKRLVAHANKQDALIKILSHSAKQSNFCLLYTSDAADDTPCVDLGGRRIIKKKKQARAFEEKPKMELTE
eukprot:TRINITY_DN42509_c0_g1_i1.p1 TRINITY_DN42509_c0_g1~~TRINITY_DN42509_c0_g1_i1.p1  ORF type:complete len:338 (+),score=71.78 TRINITY_DN42509_c0_g1_i1:43-1056(+)